MPIFGSKGTINQTIKEKTAGGKPHGGGSATAVQNRQAKERKKQIKEEAKRKKQEAADIRRRNRFRTPKTDPAKIRKSNAKAIKAGEKRRAKREARKR